MSQAQGELVINLFEARHLLLSIIILKDLNHDISGSTWSSSGNYKIQ